MPENTLFTCKIAEDGAALYDPGHPRWKTDHKATIDRFRTGESALSVKGYCWSNLTEVYSLWNDSAIFFYFNCWHDWKLEAEPETDVDQRLVQPLETVSLSIRPEGCEDYFEIFVDLAGHQSASHVIPPSLEGDRTWESAAETRVVLSEGEKIWKAFLRLPYEPMIRASNFGRNPSIGDAWRLNLSRLTTAGDERELLSWLPSNPNIPEFYVFGHLIFLGAA